jgi:hypothetical protein
MIKIIKRSGLLIPTEHKNTTFYVNIKEFLERRSKAYNTCDFIFNKFYLESEKFLLVPREFPIDKYMLSTTIDNFQHEGERININHNIKPRSKVQEKAIEYLIHNNTGILQLSPGVGKTVISIYMIAERKRKTLILVHRDSLADQWRERLLQFTNLENNQISRLKSDSFEKDLQKPIIIATVQTFLSLLKRKRKEYLISLNKANIGIFIADEVHTSVGAPTFSECSIHMPTKYNYGLSATPYRYDGNGDIIQFHLGKIFSDDDISGTMDAKVTVFLLDYKIDIPKRRRYIHWDGKFQRARYLNMLRKSKPFMIALRGLLGRLKDERDLICMIERIKLIDDLYDWLKSDNKSKFCGSATLDMLNYKNTFATPGKCRDGIDAPQKDCVITTSPISNINQLTGRILRTNPGKQIPIIIDMVDYGCRDVADTFSSRFKFYKQKKWPIQYLLFVNNQLREIDEEMALTIIRGE